MSAKRNVHLLTPYLVCSLEGVTHGVYLLWLTVHRGVSPVAAAAALAAGDLALMALEVPTGIFADRLGARRSLLLGSLCQVAGLLLLWQGRALPAVVAGTLAIAFGDAFRHGADQALVYRSYAALGRAPEFGRRFARAQAWALAAMVGLTALGGWIAERVSFNLAWALDVALAVAGLGLAGAMREPPPADGAPEDDEEGGGGFAGLRAGLPWSLLAPAAIAGTLVGAGELLVQTTRREGIGASIMATVLASGLALEALGAALVARGLIPTRARALDVAGLAALAGLGIAAVSPALALPGLLLVSLAAGAAPAIRAPLLQARAHDGERATVASAASAVDMIGKTVGLPLVAWLYPRSALRETVAVLGAAALLAWAFARASARASERDSEGKRRGRPRQLRPREPPTGEGASGG